MSKKTTIILLLSSVFLISCKSENKSLNDFKTEVSLLRKKNDSLESILRALEDKYIFDSVSVEFETNKNEGLKSGDNYEAELFIVAYSHNNNYFTEYDTITDGERINENILKGTRGFYEFKRKMGPGKNWIFVDLKMLNEYGKSMNATITDLVRIKE